MNLLEALVNTPAAGLIGWTLLHSLWQGAIIAAALGIVLLWTRSPRVRYAAGCAALLLMAGVFVLTATRLAPDIAEGYRAIETPLLLFSSERPTVETLNDPNPNFAAVIPWLAPMWVVGVWACYLWHLLGWVSARQLRTRGVCAAPEHWRRTVADLSAQLKVSKPVQLLESCLVDAPMLLGHLRPLILVPIGLLTRLPAGQVEAILLHELAHVRRNDFLTNLVQRAIEGLLFYHPAVWWISHVIRAEREKCCDDMVVGLSGDAHEYAVALAALEQNRWSNREPALAATGGSLMKRIHRLLYPPKSNRQGMPLPAALVLAALTAVSLAAWPAAAPQAVTGDTESSPYLKWVNQDVVYIMAEEERAAFESVTTDADREKFMEQFWQRRDPTPATPENEFRNEHYRRIAYANDKFSMATGRPGWQTDRGRIYIVYGPPDEIESHPSGSEQVRYGFSVWRYRHMEGLGDDLWISFIDRTMSGDYRIAPGKRPLGLP